MDHQAGESHNAGVREITPEQLTSLASEISLQPVRFGQMLKTAREARNLSKVDIHRGIRSEFKGVSYADFTTPLISRWESGQFPKAHGNGLHSFVERLRYLVLFFKWDIEKTIEQLRGTREQSSSLQPHEQTLLSMTVAALLALPADKKSVVESDLLSMVEVDLNLASLLESGLLKLPLDKRSEMLARMLHTVTTVPQD